MKDKTKPWTDFAGRDLTAAETLRTDSSMTNIVLYHCQQCVEKCLKALYEEHDLRVPRIHATLKLQADLRKAIPNLPILADNPDLEFIDGTYIDSRYPGGMGILPVGLPTLQESDRGIRIAHKVFESAMSLLE